MYDAVIVGAGPAGSATAYHLARMGRHVLLLDKDMFPRDKPCGDALTTRAVAMLKQMGLSGHLQGYLHISGMHLITPTDTVYDFSPPATPDARYALMVPRQEFDALLCQHAQTAGAEFWGQAPAVGLQYGNDGQIAAVRVEHDGQQQSVPTKVVVAADGGNSKLARTAGLLSPDTLSGTALRAYFSQVGALEDRFLFYLPMLHNGPAAAYGWVFPVKPGQANVGVGLFRTAPGDCIWNLRRLFEAFVARLQASAPWFRQATRSSRLFGAPIRADLDEERCCRANLVLVGDAAGMINPMTGEGISYALDAGQTAAESIHTALENTEGPLDLSAYGEAIARRYAREFRLNRLAVTWHAYQQVAQAELLSPLLRLLESFDPQHVGRATWQTSSLFEEGATLLERARTLTPYQPLLRPLHEQLLNSLQEVLQLAQRQQTPSHLSEPADAALPPDLTRVRDHLNGWRERLEGMRPIVTPSFL